MANTANNITPVALANTFDQWRIVTNSLVASANQMRNYDFIKDDGSLYLANGSIILSQNSGTTLSVTSNATISGTLTVSTVSVGNLSVSGTFTSNGNSFLTVANISDSINTTSSINVASLTAVQTAYNIGNLAYAQANTAYGQANAARSQANSAYGQANLAYAAANAAYNTASVSANSGTAISANGLNFVNTATVTVSVSAGANGNANIAFTSVGGGGGGNVTITNDTTTNSTLYPTLSIATSGNVAAINTSSTKLTFNPSTGTLGATIFNSLSDEKQKTNITKIVNALQTVCSVDGYEFNMLDSGKLSSGVIAQQLETIIPYLVSENEGTKSVNYDGIIGYLIEAVKELSSELNDLKGRMNDI